MLIKGSRRYGLCCCALWLWLMLPTVATAGTLPDWFQTPPADDDAWVYGIGSGRSIIEANQQALRSIAAKLGTHISSDTESRRERQQDGRTQRHFSESLNIRVDEIRLAAHEMVASAVYDEGYLILIRMSWPAFVTETSREIDSLVAARQQQRQRSGSKLADWLQCRKISALDAQIEKLQRLLLATPRQVSSPHAPLETSNRYCQQLTHDFRLAVRHDPQLQPLVAAIQSEFATPFASTRGADALLEMRVQQQEINVYGSRIVSIRLMALLRDDQNHTVTKREYQLRGSSVIDHRRAAQGAIADFIENGGAHTLISELFSY